MENSEPSEDRNIFKKISWRQKQNGEFKIEKRDNNPNHINLARKLSVNQTTPSAKQMKVLNNNQKFKIGMSVMTEWGVGKILNIMEGDIALCSIEGSDIEFPLGSLITSLSVFICILCKDSSNWAEAKIGFDFSVNNLKQKISKMIKCHPSQIVIVHNGSKVIKNTNIFDLGVYEKDVFLAIIKDPTELSILRCKNHKTTNKNPVYNAIKLRVTSDIVLTGMGLYKNNNIDLDYQILIFEEEKNSNLKLIYSEKKIIVKSEGSNESEIYKHKISNLDLKEGVMYQIHQYLDNTNNNQNIGVKCQEEVFEKNTDIKFEFFNCKIQGRTNATDIEQGMIPCIYFYTKTEN
jgi:hypothetical protein